MGSLVSLLNGISTFMGNLKSMLNIYCRMIAVVLFDPKLEGMRDFIPSQGY